MSLILKPTAQPTKMDLTNSKDQIQGIEQPGKLFQNIMKLS